MRHFLATLAFCLFAQGVFAQGVVQSPNLFWSTPLSGTGYLGLRAIGAADVSGLSLSAFSGAASCVQLPALTGDITSSGCATTLATVNGSPGAFGGANSIPTFTSNGKGLMTASGAVTPSIPFSELTGAATCSQLPALTGDITTSACASTLATVNSTPGTFGGANSIPTFTSNGKGLFTASGAVTPSIPFSELTGAATCSQLPALTGDITTAACASTLATVNGAPGVVGSSTAIPVLTTNGKGLVTTQSTAAVIAPAGTLTGATLASNVLASSITSVGTLAGGATGAGFTLAFGSSTMTGQVPVANGGTGAATFTANLPLIGNGTSAVAQGTVSGNTTKFLTFSGTATSSRCLQTDGNGNAVVAASGCAAGVAGAAATFTPANPASTTSTTIVMMGLGGTATITPANTGKVMFEITGTIANNATASCFTQLYYGTGTAPSNGSAFSGTALGAQPQSNPGPAGSGGYFVLQGVASGLTVGTAYWFDMGLARGASGTCNVATVTASAMEQ